MTQITRLAKPIAFVFAVTVVAVGVAMMPASGKSAEHGYFMPGEIPWKDGPASLPPGAKVAVLEGNPAEPGVFTIRLQFPNDYRIPPHWHPAVERITVIQGTFRLGMAEAFDQTKARAFPAGAFVYMAPRMPHFVWVEGETVVQLNGEGPWGITYLNPADDPRQMKKSAK